MKLSKIELKGFKRFNDLTIQDLPVTAKLVVMIGASGSGKSSVFDGFRTWTGWKDSRGTFYDASYHAKKGWTGDVVDHDRVAITFHGDQPAAAEVIKRIFYFRSAYRNQADFNTTSIEKQPDILDSPPIRRMVDNDATVSSNYQRVVAQALDGLFKGEKDEKKVKELREEVIGKVQASMSAVFGDLKLSGTGNPTKDGAFYFEKGVSSDYHYKNLSGGEKAAFDLLLDLVVKLPSYQDSVLCIDEPETHLHTKLQANLLAELFRLVPDGSQLWISTHSIGMMRKAVELQHQHPESVVFLDFDSCDPDGTTILTPEEVSRSFFLRALRVALDDLAELVAPATIVVCEGNPGSGRNTQFDARCLRNIFSATHPDADFVSVGSARDVETDPAGVQSAIQLLAPGTKLVQLVDRDDLSASEVTDLEDQGIRVLKRRHIESYLLDDEVIEKICNSVGQHGSVAAAQKLMADSLHASVQRNNPIDDYKSAAGEFIVGLKKLLKLKQVGNNTHSFLRDTMAPLITPDLAVFQELGHEIFD